MERLYKKIEGLIEKAQNVLIISHRHPDADTLGAAITFKVFLDKKGKKSVLACIDKPSKVFSFLPHVDEFVDDFNLKKYDLMIVVDAGASYMTNYHLKYENIFKSGIPVINIDHHASNDNYGTVNLVDSKASSTTVILYRFLRYLGAEIDNNIATCLLAGIYGDTGSFMHSNTNEEVYKIAADLMAHGGQISGVSKSLFNTKDIATLRLWGVVFQKARVTEKGVVMSVIEENDYSLAKAGPSQLTGVIDYLNMIPGTKFSVLINEDRNGNVKGSFRTRNHDVDLSEIASEFGGGGHPKASGFSVTGKLQKKILYEVATEDGETKKTLDF